MPTAVTWIGFSEELFLSVFSTQYLKNWCSQDHQLWNRNVQPWVSETHLFWGQNVKETRHKKTLPAWVMTLLWVLASCSWRFYQLLQVNGNTLINIEVYIPVYEHTYNLHEGHNQNPIRISSGGNKPENVN